MTLYFVVGMLPGLIIWRGNSFYFLSEDSLFVIDINSVMARNKTTCLLVESSTVSVSCLQK